MFHVIQYGYLQKMFDTYFQTEKSDIKYVTQERHTIVLYTFIDCNSKYSFKC